MCLSLLFILFQQSTSRVLCSRRALISIVSKMWLESVCNLALHVHSNVFFYLLLLEYQITFDPDSIQLIKADAGASKPNASIQKTLMGYFLDNATPSFTNKQRQRARISKTAVLRLVWCRLRVSLHVLSFSFASDRFPCSQTPMWVKRLYFSAYKKIHWNTLEHPVWSGEIVHWHSPEVDANYSNKYNQID